MSRRTRLVSPEEYRRDPPREPVELPERDEVEDEEAYLAEVARTRLHHGRIRRRGRFSHERELGGGRP